MITVALIGAGRRGREVYGRYIKNHCLNTRIIAVAEPNFFKRKQASIEHNISIRKQFKSYEKLLDKNRLADAIMITTSDHHHYYPTIKGIEKGYKIILEKPIAPDFKQFKDIVIKAREHNNQILVTHPLRYTPFYRTIVDVINKGIIGEIKAIDHNEHIGYYHFVHSYVRGNWRNDCISAPLFLAKSSHDFDLLYWFLNRKCLEVFAGGRKTYFNKENHPDDAGENCLDCKAEPNCPYSARHIYLTDDLPWPKDIIEEMPSKYFRKVGVRFTGLGKCVYLCDNTMPEFLTASLLFEDDIRVNFTITGLSKEMTRITNIFGTKGEIRADFARNKIWINPYRGKENIISPSVERGGHGGGDFIMIKEFDKFLGELESDKNKNLTTLELSIESHLAAFAAEKSRKENRPVSLSSLRNELSLSPH
ncbi:Gfo/Idh/MocA family protein [Natranaerofaba carboxydovora]|uniref:Gfo/Idh/MocA family protein n=1 Tax=Natranaerofaba carboxydovora TaxID=2742683 RepID=UPI001F138183|nr:Gfo/Idh/MocA family oxidoreductase [Natranaerofaba carboxydovora]UMZ73657.1 Putative oxidoreductase YteT [Natranaerofaba carboxydovora]